MPRHQSQNTFPLSVKRVIKDGFDKEKHDPLHFLHPHEAKAAELFALMDGQPETVSTLPGTPRKWTTMLSGAFCTRWRETFGYEITPRIRKGLELNPAWRHYVYLLKTKPRDAVMKLLEEQGMAAARDFIEARVMAKAAADYKELRLAASDHLDRLGATQKPTAVQQNVVVVLKGRNYTAENLGLDNEDAEIVVEAVRQLQPGDGE